MIVQTRAGSLIISFAACPVDRRYKIFCESYDYDDGELLWLPPQFLSLPPYQRRYWCR